MAIGAIPRARRLAASAAVAALLGSTLLPVAGQAATSFSWQQGPGAVAGTTIFGTVTSPTDGQTIQGGKVTNVTGWAFDPSSSIDQVQVWANGGPDTGGMPLALSGQTGLTNTEAAQVLGSDAALKSGFRATLDNNLVTALLTPGSTSTLNVFVHSKANGWWFKSVVVNVGTPITIQFQNQPINVIGFPKNGDILSLNTVNKSNNTGPSVTFVGWALDLNLAVNPGANPGNSAALAGVDRVQLWLDGPRGVGECLAGCGQGPTMGALVISQSGGNNNLVGTASAPQAQAFFNGGGANFVNTLPGATYGPQFALAGWSFSFNMTRASVGDHTLTVYARSSITGNETVDMSTFTIQAARA